MSRVDVNEIEREVRASYRNDGITLIVMGFWLSSIGICCSCAIQFWGLAAILIAIGLTQLALVRRRHPVPAEEGLDDNS